jgi:2-dehydro-3-deoxyphosphooctonate aldolase (KDO 8-P synthase)
VVESKENLFEIAAHLNAVCDTLKIPLVLKASYKKANRSKLSSFTGIGNEKAL